jgi:hypothetical protein
MVGLAFPFLYEKVKVEIINLSKSTCFRVLWHAIIPIGLAIAGVFAFNFDTHVELPSIWVSFGLCFAKNYWSIIGCVFMIGIIQRIKCEC